MVKKRVKATEATDIKEATDGVVIAEGVEISEVEADRAKAPKAGPPSFRAPSSRRSRRNESSTSGNETAPVLSAVVNGMSEPPKKRVAIIAD